MHGESGLVLVVDDQPAIRYSLRRFLQHAGFLVQECANGRELLDALATAPERYDAVLLDVKLPDLSGYELCRRIKANPATVDIPVIHLTASYADDVSKARGLEGGADAYLTHPIEPHVLVATIRALLRLRRSRQELRELLQKERDARHAADEARRRREELYEELRRADRAKEEFIAMLAHELRNPLEPIVTAAHVVASAEPGSDASRRAREVITRQIRQMARLVDDLLDVSRINSGRIELKREMVELGPLLRQLGGDYQPQLEQRGLTLELDLRDDPLWLDADPTRVAQVIGNLLHNASKFSSRGGQVRVEARRESHGTARITVRDTGIGMDGEVLATLFQPFAQGDRTFERSLGGLGLGLALARGLVTLHGGTIEARSEGEGKGSEFTVRLPLAEAPPPSAEPRRQPEERRSLSVLVIDDNVDTADSMSDYLQLLGHRARVAYSGPEGLETARGLRPDVVLCDLGLPGLDGYQVASALKSAPETAAVYLVAISGYGHSDDRARAIQSGFDLHLTKPVDPTLLETLLQARPAT